MVSHLLFARPDFKCFLRHCLETLILAEIACRAGPNFFWYESLKTNISEEIQDLTANNIGQKLGTLGRHLIQDKTFRL